MNDTFYNYHPIVNFIYFGLVIAFGMMLNHPFAQVIGLFCAAFYGIQIEGKNSILFMLKFCLPMVLLTAFINPAFNHEGVTTLLYFPSGNPLTLESILYGFSAGAMLITILLWFSSFSRVMTSDKFIYLFGKLIPALSLVLSMSLRFVPKFKSQMDTVIEAQRSIGRDISNGSVLQRTKTAIVIFSIMLTWALENAIETADSMKSRGYGLKNRTAFSIYTIEKRDQWCMIWLGVCTAVLAAGLGIEAFGFRYFPSIKYQPVNWMTMPFYVVYFCMCITPVVLNKKEERMWKIIYSKM